jgi:hypothetical protein
MISNSIGNRIQLLGHNLIKPQIWTIVREFVIVIDIGLQQNGRVYHQE